MPSVEQVKEEGHEEAPHDGPEDLVPALADHHLYIHIPYGCMASRETTHREGEGERVLHRPDSSGSLGLSTTWHVSMYLVDSSSRFARGVVEGMCNSRYQVLRGSENRMRLHILWKPLRFGII